MSNFEELIKKAEQSQHEQSAEIYGKAYEIAGTPERKIKCCKKLLEVYLETDQLLGVIENFERLSNLDKKNRFYLTKSKDCWQKIFDFMDTENKKSAKSGVGGNLQKFARAGAKKTTPLMRLITYFRNLKQEKCYLVSVKSCLKAGLKYHAAMISGKLAMFAQKKYQKHFKEHWKKKWLRYSLETADLYLACQSYAKAGEYYLTVINIKGVKPKNVEKSLKKSLECYKKAKDSFNVGTCFEWLALYAKDDEQKIEYRYQAIVHLTKERQYENWNVLLRLLKGHKESEKKLEYCEQATQLLVSSGHYVLAEKFLLEFFESFLAVDAKKAEKYFKKVLGNIERQKDDKNIENYLKAGSYYKLLSLQALHKKQKLEYCYQSLVYFCKIKNYDDLWKTTETLLKFIEEQDEHKDRLVYYKKAEQLLENSGNSLSASFSTAFAKEIDKWKYYLESATFYARNTVTFLPAEADEIYDQVRYIHEHYDKVRDHFEKALLHAQNPAQLAEIMETAVKILPEVADFYHKQTTDIYCSGTSLGVNYKKQFLSLLEMLASLSEKIKKEMEKSN